jgi:hypothetical protein
MKRMLLLAGLILLGVAPSPGEASKDCVPDTGCPKKVGPPKCCKPPPCEFRQAMKEARAKKRSYYKTMGYFLYTASLPGESGGYDADILEGAYEITSDAAEQAIQKARQKYGKCPKKNKIPDPPIFSVLESDQCRIKAYVAGEFQELSSDQVQAESKSCSELVDAKWDAALNRQSDCHLSSQDPKDYLGRAQRRGQELEAEYQSLLGALQNYWSRCSVKRGSKIARELAAAGINELKFNPPKGPKKKGPPKKSGK